MRENRLLWFARPFVFSALSLCASNVVWADHPSLGFSEDNAGPIQTITATPMTKGKWGAGVSVEFQKFTPFADHELREFARTGRTVDSTDYLLSPAVSLVYGLLENLTLIARLPFPNRDNIREGESEDGVLGIHKHGDGSGMGDLVALGKFRILADPVEIAPVLGLKAPTGQTHDKDQTHRRFETDHQPGSGSWDGLFGLAVTKRFRSWTVSASGLYTLATEGAQETDLGDQIALAAGISYRLGWSEQEHLHEHAHHHSHSDSGAPHHAERKSSMLDKVFGRHVAVDLVLDGVYEHQQAHVVQGRKDPESGGDQIWIAPGIRLNLGHWKWGYFSWATSVGVPVMQDFNGAQHEPEYKVLSVLSAGF